MLRTAVVAVLLLAAGFVARAQTGAGSWEFSLSSNFGLTSQSTEYSSPYMNGEIEGESEGFLALAVRPGYYLVDGLAFEPEFLWTAIEGVPPSFSLSGNLAYNFHLKESNVAPFILVGYGVGNAIPVFQRVYVRGSDEMDITVLNAGAGVKFFFTDHVAFRLEYRFQQYNQEDSSGSYSAKRTTQFHNVFMGIAFFIPS
ncbi:MAG: outer membrane beta-barrel protein [Bacteroidota bacterium]